MREMAHCVGERAKALKLVRRFAVACFDAFFPAVCCGCGRLFSVPRLPDKSCEPSGEPSFSKLMRGYLCAACASDYHAVRSPVCVQCGEPFVSRHGLDHICGQCHEHPFCFHSARAAGLYQGGLREAIHQLKYHGRDHLAGPLGRLLWQTLQHFWDPSQIDRVVPVPLHPSRLRERGFNQAHLLVRQWPALAAQRKMAIASDWIDSRLLVRHRPTSPQIGLKKDQRATNVSGAFGIASGRRLGNDRVLLVDDVMTTGITANTCARTLLRAGAAEVRVITLARAV